MIAVLAIVGAFLGAVVVATILATIVVHYIGGLPWPWDDQWK